MSKLPFVIVLIGVFAALYLTVVECRWYQSGLIFYDLSTRHTLLPPAVSVQRGRSMKLTNIPIFSKLGQPCTCKGLKCGCCAGLQVREYNFDQKMCANVTFVPEKAEALLDVFLNEESRAKYGISARNPSPLCVPIMMPVPMAACIQMTDVGLKGDNLHMCMDFVMRLHTTDAMELHFNCLSMGRDGIQYLDKNGNPVLPRAPEADRVNNNKNDDADDEEEDYYYDQVEESQQDEQKQVTNGGLNEEAEENFDGEESGDGQNNENENDPSEGETEDYEDEDEDDLGANEEVNEVTKRVLDQTSTVKPTTEEYFITDNLIRVYETV